MTREELKKKLEDLQNREFFINMADRFTAADWEALDRIHAEMRQIIAALNAA